MRFMWQGVPRGVDVRVVEGKGGYVSRGDGGPLGQNKFAEET